MRKVFKGIGAFAVVGALWLGGHAIAEATQHEWNAATTDAITCVGVGIGVGSLGIVVPRVAEDHKREMTTGLEELTSNPIV